MDRNMPEETLVSRWWRTISRRTQEREIRRLAWYGHTRMAFAGRGPLTADFADRFPAIWRDFARMSLGALIAFWLAGFVLSWAFAIEPLFVYLLFGLFYSAQSAYYRYRLGVDPNFRIPSCGCAKTPRTVDTEKVLKSTQGELLPWVSNALLATMLYAMLLALAWDRQLLAAGTLAAAACLFGAYLGYVMVFKIGSLCVNCINIAALNLLVVARLWL
jgi:uncharacterized membrane protein